MAKSFYTDGVGNEQTLTNSQDEKVVIYDTITDAQSDLSNLEEGQIIGTKSSVSPLTLTDTVQNGNMNAVTSNGVYNALQNVSMPVYATLQDAETDLPNLNIGQIVATEDGQLFSTTDTVVSGNMHPVTSNAVYDAVNTTPQLETIVDVSGDALVVMQRWGKFAIFYVHSARAYSSPKTYSIAPYSVSNSFANCCLLQSGGQIMGEAYFPTSQNLVIASGGTGDGQISVFLD